MPTTTCQPRTNTESPSNRLGCHPSNQGSSLLEEWPCHDSVFYFHQKKVTFSEYSELRFYNTNRSHESNKSYSSADTKSFQVQAVFDASRIRHLVSHNPIRTGHSIEYAVNLGWIKQEELVGIEHLLSNTSAASLVNRRRAHVASVLKAQQLLQENYEYGVDTVMLAKIASRLSAKCVKKAQMRAAWTNVDGNEIHTSSTMTLEMDNIAKG